jgi:integral membrane protein
VSTSRRVVSRIVPAYVQDGEGLGLPPGLDGAIARYRIMAFVVGIGLLLLVFVGVPLQYGAGMPQVEEVVGTLHGFLYIVYLLCAVDLARRARFTLLQLAAMIGAGFLPFLAFVIEHRVMQRMGLLRQAHDDALVSGSGSPS